MKLARTTRLLNGETSSCGCLKSEKLSKAHTTHNNSNSRLHRIWTGMKTRCYNPKSDHKKSYYDRKIIICDEWLNDFVNFYNWAMANGYDDELTIDRIDNGGNYEPLNCRWVTMSVQNSNKRNTTKIFYKGKCKTLKQWSEELGIYYQTLYYRYKNNKPIEELFSKKI